MFQQTKKYLVPPIFEDEDKTRIASLLNTILLAALVVIFIYSLLAPFVDPNPVPALIFIGVFAVYIVGLLILMRHGRVRLASLLFSLVAFVGIVGSVYAFGGVRSGSFSALVIVVLIGSTLLGSRIGIGLAGLSILAGGVMLYAENAGLLIPDATYLTPANAWSSQTMILILAAVLFHLASRSITESLARVRRNQRALAEANQALQQEIARRRQAEAELKVYSERLEEMVAERTQALQEAQERLLRQERLAVLGQLAGGVGHELRNPLGVITNAIYFLQIALADADEKIKEYLTLISGRVQEAERIVSDLLNLSRTRTAVKETISVSALVNETLTRHQPPPDITVSTDISADVPTLFVDPQQIGQVLTNLITNAYQAMPDGGQLTIRARQWPAQVHLAVADSGNGMTPETMQKVFEPLFTTKARGIGLGLAVSRNLIEINGGKLEVESKIDEGSTFTLVLPIATAVD